MYRNIVESFFSKSYILFSYLSQLVLFPKLTEANIDDYTSMQDANKSNTYSLSLKPYANASTYLLDSEPDHLFLNVANKEFILCKLVRELNFSYEAVNSWYLRPVSQAEREHGIGTIEEDNCPENFIINLHHIREIKDFISNITIPEISNNITNFH